MIFGVLKWQFAVLYFRHLDISQPTEKHGKFVDENQTLLHLVQSLPNLESLDISGTNLAGTGQFGFSKQQPKID